MQPATGSMRYFVPCKRRGHGDGAGTTMECRCMSIRWKDGLRRCRRSRPRHEVLATNLHGRTEQCTDHRGVALIRLTLAVPLLAGAFAVAPAQAAEDQSDAALTQTAASPVDAISDEIGRA